MPLNLTPREALDWIASLSSKAGETGGLDLPGHKATVTDYKVAMRTIHNLIMQQVADDAS